MRCDEISPLLQAEVDRELGPVDSRAVQQHLTGCESCRGRQETLLALRAVVRQHAERPEVTGELWTRLSTSPATAPSPAPAVTPPVVGSNRRRRWARPLGALLAATAACLFSFNLGTHVGEQGLDPAEELVAAHLRSLQVAHLTDVTSSDHHTVKPWFQGKIDFSLPVTDLTEQGFPLVGGRLDYVGGRSVAVLVYRRRQHVINVFAWPAQVASEPSRVTSRHGYHCLQWTTGSLHYVATSDVNIADLSELQHLIDAAG